MDPRVFAVVCDRCTRYLEEPLPPPAARGSLPPQALPAGPSRSGSRTLVVAIGAVVVLAIVITIAAVTGGGSSHHDDDESERAFAGYVDKVCGCKSADCVSQATERMGSLQKSTTSDFTPRMRELADRLAACMATVMQAEMPSAPGAPTPPPPPRLQPGPH
jgi:hypothetical protein